MHDVARTVANASVATRGLCGASAPGASRQSARRRVAGEQLVWQLGPGDLVGPVGAGVEAGQGDLDIGEILFDAVEIDAGARLACSAHRRAA